MGKKDFNAKFDSIFQQPEQTTTKPTKVAETPIKVAKKAIDKSKHNFEFDNELWEKLKILQRQTGKTATELLDIIVRRYVDDYEKRFGELKNDIKLL